MNKALTQEIINHIFSGFSVLQSGYFNNSKFKSLKSSEFLLSEKVSFEDDDGRMRKNNIWGVQFTIENSPLKILLADCSVEKNILEYAMLVSLKDSPSYGLYSAYSLDDEKIDSVPLIAVSVDNQNWMSCNTYFQATFLAGMENTKELTYAPSNCTDYKSNYNLLLSFIKYHSQINGDGE